MPDLNVTQLLWVIAFLLLLILIELGSMHVTLNNPNRTARKEAAREMEKYEKEAERERKAREANVEPCPTCNSREKGTRAFKKETLTYCQDPWHGDEGREYSETLIKHFHAERDREKKTNP